MTDGRKKVHGAYRHRYAPFSCYVAGYRPLALPLGEVAERSEDGEGGNVKKTCRCRHVKKICQWHIFSVNLSGYAAVASIRTYTTLSWMPSQSPAVTALPKGEARNIRAVRSATFNLLEKADKTRTGTADYPTEPVPCLKQPAQRAALLFYERFTARPWPR